jgi:hypothetical protein
MRDEERELIEVLRHSLEVQKGILRLMLVQMKVPVALQIHYEGFTMPMQIEVGQTVTATATETDANSQPVNISDPGSLNWTSSDPTVASVVGTGEGVVFTGVAVGSVNVTCTDPATNLSATDVLTVVAVPDPATNVEIVWGQPQGV